MMEGNGQKTNDDGRERKSIDISGAAFESESPARSFTRLCVRTYARSSAIKTLSNRMPDAIALATKILFSRPPARGLEQFRPLHSIFKCARSRASPHQTPLFVHFFPLFRISNIFFPFLLHSKYESIISLSLSLLFRFLHLRMVK